MRSQLGRQESSEFHRCALAVLMWMVTSCGGTSDSLPKVEFEVCEAITLPGAIANSSTASFTYLKLDALLQNEVGQAEFHLSFPKYLTARDALAAADLCAKHNQTHFYASILDDFPFPTTYSIRVLLDYDKLSPKQPWYLLFESGGFVGAAISDGPFDPRKEFWVDEIPSTFERISMEEVIALARDTSVEHPIQIAVEIDLPIPRLAGVLSQIDPTGSRSFLLARGIEFPSAFLVEKPLTKPNSTERRPAFSEEWTRLRDYCLGDLCLSPFAIRFASNLTARDLGAALWAAEHGEFYTVQFCVDGGKHTRNLFPVCRPHNAPHAKIFAVTMKDGVANVGAVYDQLNVWREDPAISAWWVRPKPIVDADLNRLTEKMPSQEVAWLLVDHRTPLGDVADLLQRLRDRGFQEFNFDFY